MPLFKTLKITNFVTKKVFGDKKPSEVLATAKPYLLKQKELVSVEIKKIRSKLADIPGTNYELGLYHFYNGNYEEAMFRFKMVAYLLPTKATAYFYLGRSQLQLHHKDNALENFKKALELDATIDEARYFITKLEDPAAIETIPDTIIKEHLKQQEKQDESILKSREIRDKFIAQSALQAITDKNPNLNILDLGIASGGRAITFKAKQVAKNIVGVDLNETAIAHCSNLLIDQDKVYQNLHNESISSYLQRCVRDNSEAFDLILAGDVFIYQRNLDSVFKNIAANLKNGGIFAAIYKKNNLERDSMLDLDSDKFMHADSYFEGMLAANGLRVLNKTVKEVNSVDFCIVIATKQPSLKI